MQVCSSSQNPGTGTIEQFKWVRKVKKMILRTFPDYDEATLHLLEKNIHEEFENVLKSNDRKRTENFFQLLKYYYRTFRWNPNSNEGELGQTCVQLLYYILYIGLLLSDGNRTSPLLDELVTIWNFSGNVYLLLDALLLIKNIGIKYLLVYKLILRHILKSYISQPPNSESFLKIILLYRRLRDLTRNVGKKSIITSIASKVKCPPGFNKWITTSKIAKLSSLSTENLADIVMNLNSQQIQLIYQGLYENKYSLIKSHVSQSTTHAVRKLKSKKNQRKRQKLLGKRKLKELAASENKRKLEIENEDLILELQCNAETKIVKQFKIERENRNRNLKSNSAKNSSDDTYIKMAKKCKNEDLNLKVSLKPNSLKKATCNTNNKKLKKFTVKREKSHLISDSAENDTDKNIERAKKYENEDFNKKLSLKPIPLRNGSCNTNNKKIKKLKVKSENEDLKSISVKNAAVINTAKKCKKENEDLEPKPSLKYIPVELDSHNIEDQNAIFISEKCQSVNKTTITESNSSIERAFTILNDTNVHKESVGKVINISFQINLPQKVSTPAPLNNHYRSFIEKCFETCALSVKSPFEKKPFQDILYEKCNTAVNVDTSPLDLTVNRESKLKSKAYSCVNQDNIQLPASINTNGLEDPDRSSACSIQLFTSTITNGLENTDHSSTGNIQPSTTIITKGSENSDHRNTGNIQPSTTIITEGSENSNHRNTLNIQPSTTIITEGSENTDHSNRGDIQLSTTIITEDLENNHNSTDSIHLSTTTITEGPETTDPLQKYFQEPGVEVEINKQQQEKNLTVRGESKLRTKNISTILNQNGLQQSSNFMFNGIESMDLSQNCIEQTIEVSPEDLPVQKELDHRTDETWFENLILPSASILPKYLQNTDFSHTSYFNKSGVIEQNNTDPQKGLVYSCRYEDMLPNPTVNFLDSKIGPLTLQNSYNVMSSPESLYLNPKLPSHSTRYLRLSEGMYSDESDLSTITNLSEEYCDEPDPAVCSIKSKSNFNLANECLYQLEKRSDQNSINYSTQVDAMSDDSMNLISSSCTFLKDTVECLSLLLDNVHESPKCANNKNLIKILDNDSTSKFDKNNLSCCSYNLCLNSNDFVNNKFKKSNAERFTENFNNISTIDSSSHKSNDWPETNSNILNLCKETNISEAKSYSKQGVISLADHSSLTHNSMIDNDSIKASTIFIDNRQYQVFNIDSLDLSDNPDSNSVDPGMSKETNSFYSKNRMLPNKKNRTIGTRSSKLRKSRELIFESDCDPATDDNSINTVSYPSVKSDSGYASSKHDSEAKYKPDTDCEMSDNSMDTVSFNNPSVENPNSLTMICNSYVPKFCETEEPLYSNLRNLNSIYEKSVLGTSQNRKNLKISSDSVSDLGKIDVLKSNITNILSGGLQSSIKKSVNAQSFLKKSPTKVIQQLNQSIKSKLLLTECGNNSSSKSNSPKIQTIANDYEDTVKTPVVKARKILTSKSTKRYHASPQKLFNRDSKYNISDKKNKCKKILKDSNLELKVCDNNKVPKISSNYFSSVSYKRKGENTIDLSDRSFQTPIKSKKINTSRCFSPQKKRLAKSKDKKSTLQYPVKNNLPKTKVSAGETDFSSEEVCCKNVKNELRNKVHPLFESEKDFSYKDSLSIQTEKNKRSTLNLEKIETFLQKETVEKQTVSADKTDICCQRIQKKRKCQRKSIKPLSESESDTSVKSNLSVKPGQNNLKLRENKTFEKETKKQEVFVGETGTCREQLPFTNKIKKKIQPIYESDSENSSINTLSTKKKNTSKEIKSFFDTESQEQGDTSDSEFHSVSSSNNESERDSDNNFVTDVDSSKETEQISFYTAVDNFLEKESQGKSIVLDSELNKSSSSSKSVCLKKSFDIGTPFDSSVANIDINSTFLTYINNGSDLSNFSATSGPVSVNNLFSTNPTGMNFDKVLESSICTDKKTHAVENSDKLLNTKNPIQTADYSMEKTRDFISNKDLENVLKNTSIKVNSEAFVLNKTSSERMFDKPSSGEVSLFNDEVSAKSGKYSFTKPCGIDFISVSNSWCLSDEEYSNFPQCFSQKTPLTAEKSSHTQPSDMSSNELQEKGNLNFTTLKFYSPDLQKLDINNCTQHADVLSLHSLPAKKTLCPKKLSKSGKINFNLLQKETLNLQSRSSNAASYKERSENGYPKKDYNKSSMISCVLEKQGDKKSSCKGICFKETWAKCNIEKVVLPSNINCSIAALHPVIDLGVKCDEGCLELSISSSNQSQCIIGNSLQPFNSTAKKRSANKFNLRATRLKMHNCHICDETKTIKYRTVRSKMRCCQLCGQTKKSPIKKVPRKTKERKGC